MIASLMMYTRPELEAAHNHYWLLIRKFLAQSGIDSPENLDQKTKEFAVWNDPALVLSQTCGMPYRTQLHDHVTLIGTPDFGVNGCPPGYYRSALVIRRAESRTMLTEFQGACFAYNESFSQSGYAAPYWQCHPHGFWFENRLHTKQHLQSACAVAKGHADIAAIDAVTWRLICQYEDFAANLRVLEWTEATPALPYIAAKAAPQKETFVAVSQAIAALSSGDRALLGLKGIIYIPAEAYLAVPNP